MSFIWPPMLLLLLLDPAGVALYVVRERRVAGGAWPRYGGAAARATRRPRASAAAGTSRPRSSCVGAHHPDRGAGPSAEPWSACRAIEGTVILAFDVSGSMAADDLTPTRMDAAKAARPDFRRAPAHDRPDRRRRLQRQRLLGPGADQRPDDGAGRHRPARRPQRGTSLGEGILASLDDDRPAADADPDPRLLHQSLARRRPRSRRRCPPGTTPRP